MVPWLTRVSAMKSTTAALPCASIVPVLSTVTVLPPVKLKVGSVTLELAWARPAISAVPETVRLEDPPPGLLAI